MPQLLTPGSQGSTTGGGVLQRNNQLRSPLQISAALTLPGLEPRCLGFNVEDIAGRGEQYAKLTAESAATCRQVQRDEWRLPRRQMPDCQGKGKDAPRSREKSLLGHPSGRMLLVLDQEAATWSWHQQKRAIPAIGSTGRNSDGRVNR